MKASIVSHSYIAPENRKNIDALARSLQLNVILPQRAADRIFDELDAGTVENDSGPYRVFPRLHCGGSQYLLASRDLSFRAFAPDVVHVEYDPWSAIFWQSLACRNVFAPAARIVCTVKNNTYRRFPGFVGTAKDDLALAGIRNVDHFIAASFGVADLYRRLFGVSRSRIRVATHLAVDTDLFSPGTVPVRNETGSGRTIGYCGRLDEDKGVLELIDAVARCRADTDEDLNLLLLGNGRLRQSLVERSSDTNWLRLHDPVPHGEVPRFLRRLDLFVLPARVSEEHEEHDAHALLEAMAVGLPCIGTRSGIIPEILGDGSGVLVEPNVSASLARAIAELLATPGQMRRLGSRSRSKALDSFSLEAVATAKVEVYREVLQHGG